MVIATGFSSRMRAMIIGRAPPERSRHERRVSRRKLITRGVAAAAGASGLAATPLAWLPDMDSSRPITAAFRVSAKLCTYATQRILMSHQSLAREFIAAKFQRVGSRQWRSAADEPLALASRRFRRLAAHCGWYGGAPISVLP